MTSIASPSQLLAVPRRSGSVRREQGLGLAGRDYLSPAISTIASSTNDGREEAGGGSRPSASTTLTGPRTDISVKPCAANPTKRRAVRRRPLTDRRTDKERAARAFDAEVTLATLLHSVQWTLVPSRDDLQTSSSGHYVSPKRQLHRARTARSATLAQEFERRIVEIPIVTQLLHGSRGKHPVGATDIY
jgi:hypothetical protein